MCSFIKTCTAGAPAATQRPEKSVNKNSIRWRQYTNTKNGTNTNRLQTQPSRYIQELKTERKYGHTLNTSIKTTTRNTSLRDESRSNWLLDNSVRRNLKISFSLKIFERENTLIS